MQFITLNANQLNASSVKFSVNNFITIVLEILVVVKRKWLMLEQHLCAYPLILHKNLILINVYCIGTIVTKIVKPSMFFFHVKCNFIEEQIKFAIIFE